MVNADGMSVVWASRVLGDALPERVAGIDLFERLVRAASEDGTSVYFLGATEEVVNEVAAVYSRRYPGLRIAGSHNGYWDDDDAVIDAVRACAPDYLFLAIPSPRKEFWVRDHLEALGTPFVMGVGGSFDVVAGKVARARHAGPSRPGSNGHGDSHRSRAGCGADTSTPTPRSCGSRRVNG